MRQLMVVVCCVQAWPTRRARQAFDVALCVFIYVVPGLVVAASYIATGRTLLSGGHDVVLLRRDAGEVLLLLLLLF